MIKTKTIFGLIVGAVVVVGSIFTFNFIHSRDGIKTAQKAVKLLYEYDSFEELRAEHLEPLSELMTDETFKGLAVNSVEDSLVKYLKFKNNPCQVAFIESSDNYIIYTIKCDSLTYGRKFIFFYDTNIWGKINKVEEAELRDFSKASSSISND